MSLATMWARFSLLLCLTRVILGYEYETKSFQVPVDHFSFTTNDTFSIRYLINETFWRPPNGPIFFYTGNEGEIELFAENAGLMWDIAPRFGAMLVFGEHRYYGHSLPYGNKSFTEPRYSGYLTSQQALADYVDLITFLRNGRNNRVVAFGGSYGGMLAAYLRIKYPHIAQGAIASSAPIFQFPGLRPCNTFFTIATSGYKRANTTCPQVIRQAWLDIDTITENDEGKEWLTKTWSLCQPLKSKEDVFILKNWLQETLTNLAMVNYPYPANFLGDLPAWPVNEFCSRLQAPLSPPSAVLTGLYRGINLAINYTGQATCFDFNDSTPSGLGDQGWDYQSCTEMVMPMCPNGVDDMYEKNDWDFNKFSDDCYTKFRVRPDPDLAIKIYGGTNLFGTRNIVFTNGVIDPWSSGGVTINYGKTVIAVSIGDGAHHLDLRAANPSDPDSVLAARKTQLRNIKQWISL